VQLNQLCEECTVLDEDHFLILRCRIDLGVSKNAYGCDSLVWMIITLLKDMSK